VNGFARVRALGLALQAVSCAAERDEALTDAAAANPEPSPPTAAPEAAASVGPSTTASASVPASVSDAPAASLTTNGEDGSWPSAERLAVGFPKPEAGARIFSKSRHLWIRKQAGGSDWLGYLSLGDSVRLKGGDAAIAYAGGGDGVTCEAWYAVEPRGFACTGSEGTLDPNDPEVIELVRTRANVASPWPYHYGESLGAPVALTLPGAPASPGASKTSPPLFALGPGGRSLTTEIHPGSTVAFTDTFEHDGRSLLLTWDRGIIDADRVRAYPESPFHGVTLGPHRKLPLAFVKADDGGDELHRTDEGRFEPLAAKLPRLEVVELTGRTEKVGNASLHETRRGTWVRDAQVGVAREPTEVPLLASASQGRKTWIDISIVNGTLVAYEDRRPVYATLISPGRGGPPVPGKPPLATASTPTGVFAVLGKFTTATMISSTVSTFVHTEVNYPQNFEGPYSLHGAYWHDRWGQKKSAGCVNLAPIDARRLFAWTDPPLPEGWHGLKSVDAPGHRTVVAIHR